MTRRTRREEELILSAVARLRAGILALVFGVTCGLGLFVATVWLVLRGGEVVGPHLGLLGIYLPGYEVSWGGAFLGLLYGALLGAAVGSAIGWTYNKLSLRRDRRR